MRGRVDDVKQHAKLEMTKELGDGMLAVLRGLTACVGQDELKFEQQIGQGGAVFLGTVLDKYKFVTVNLKDDGMLRGMIEHSAAKGFTLSRRGCSEIFRRRRGFPTS